MGPRYSDVQRRGGFAATARRDAVLDWLRGYCDYCDPLTAREIASRSGLYEGNGRQERCSRDMRALERHGLVETDRRVGGRWRPVFRPGAASMTDGPR